MRECILWLDNDKVFLRGHFMRLEVEEYAVKHISTLSQAIQEISNSDYNLFILDVMLRVEWHEQEEFPPDETEFGRSAGLVFYQRYRNALENKGIEVFVFTTRNDMEIRDQFIEAGLPRMNFMTKTEGADTSVFIERIKEILREDPE